ncbi:MAG: mechanosensitive ion channel [Candidatus Eisenbacteria bacterium]|uniref:Mechanosensitive ion channel n=1 Tax=Eiseniibacteriota bacterium TaxID=2212470 RepID=A0A956SGC2_UNCEI|nr:mechanosensitive ion channel [Candidatus Eisenbacteria bacterium]
MDATILRETTNAFQSKVESWGDSAVAMLPNFAVAVGILVIFWILARIARWSVRRVLSKLAERSAATTLFGNLTYLSILLVGTFIGLGIIGLDKTVTSMLAGVGVVGLALGFAFQDLAANFVSGVMMSFRQPFRPGDVIETNDFMGTVQQIHLRTTVIRTFEGQIVEIPNKMIFANPLVNFSSTGVRRIDLTVGVSYGDNLELAAERAAEAIRDLEFAREDPEVQVYFRGFGDSAINMEVQFWITYPGTDPLRAKDRAVIAVKRAFDDAEVSIPFPIRTFDFGIRGGVPLESQLRNVWPPRHGSSDDEEAQKNGHHAVAR